MEELSKCSSAQVLAKVYLSPNLQKLALKIISRVLPSRRLWYLTIIKNCLWEARCSYLQHCQTAFSFLPLLKKLFSSQYLSSNMPSLASDPFLQVPTPYIIPTASDGLFILLQCVVNKPSLVNPDLVLAGNVKYLLEWV